MDTKTFAENWKEKGGYEGLMANPGFLLGLGIIQSSAQGKPIGSDIFDIATKTGAISAQYADRIKARTANIHKTRFLLLVFMNDLIVENPSK